MFGNTRQHWALGAAQCPNYYGRSCCTTESDLLANPSFVKLLNNSFNFQRYCRGTFTKSYKKTIGVDFLEKQLRVQSEEVSAKVLTQCLCLCLFRNDKCVYNSSAEDAEINGQSLTHSLTALSDRVTYWAILDSYITGLFKIFNTGFNIRLWS